MKSWFWALCSLVTVLPLVSANAAQSKFAVSTTESYLTPYVQSNNFTGNVLIEKKGKIVFEKSYGLANREKEIRNNNSTRFHVASVSMQFTAAAVLRLIDQGALGMGTHVGDVVAGVPGGDKITVRDVLMERSGLPDINDLPDYGEVLKEHQTPTTLVAKIKDRPPLFEPGTKFLHEEHSAYNLLALMVEKKTGLPFASAMKKLVFEPAGLSKSFIDDDTAAAAPGIAQGYQPVGVYGLEPGAPIHWSAKTGNASVVTTARDQAHWTRLLFGSRFLKKASLDAILDTAQKPGYGWFRKMSPRYQETIYYMNGRAPGFASFVLYLPNEEMTIVVFSNLYSSATTMIGNDLAAIALGLPYEAFKPSDPAPSAEEVKNCEGTFRFGSDFYQPNAEVNLIAKGGELSLRWPSGDISPLIPFGQDRFVDRSYWEEVSIERDPGGRPKTLVYGSFRGSASQPN